MVVRLLNRRGDGRRSGESRAIATFNKPDLEICPRSLPCYDSVMMHLPFATSLRASLLTVSLAIFTITPASSAILWDWNYSGSGIAASGTLITVDSPNGSGGYLITAITGTRNGETITGLQPTGTAIPGNEPFVVDNLVFAGPVPQLTGDGFGFSTSGGNYSNVFFADFLPTPGFLEFFSKPPFAVGMPGPEDSELAVSFSAVPVPEPPSGLLAISSLMLICSLLKLSQNPAWISSRKTSVGNITDNHATRANRAM